MKKITRLARRRLENAIDFFEDDLNRFFDEAYKKLKESIVFPEFDNLALSRIYDVSKEEFFDNSMKSWHWHMKTPIRSRLLKMYEKYPEFFEYITEKKMKNQPVKLLDLGSGFCAYWPIFQFLGVTSFCGIDQYDTRKSEILIDTMFTFALKSNDLYTHYNFKENNKTPTDNHFIWKPIRSREDAFLSILSMTEIGMELYYESKQEYFKTAKKLVNNLKIKDARLIQGSVYDVDSFLSKEDEKSFDLIFAFNPGPCKPIDGNLGIAEYKFEKIVEKYLKSNGIFALDDR